MKIVDFAGGRGDFGLVLAFLFPDHDFLIADIKKNSIL
jgi:hypothetical protein